VDGTCGTSGQKRNVYRLLVGEPEGKRPLRRPRRRWVDNIKLDLVRIEWSGVRSIALVESPCERGYDPSSSTKCCETLE
jgi:hypothetical protein